MQEIRRLVTSREYVSLQLQKQGGPCVLPFRRHLIEGPVTGLADGYVLGVATRRSSESSSLSVNLFLAHPPASSLAVKSGDEKHGTKPAH